MTEYFLFAPNCSFTLTATMWNPCLFSPIIASQALSGFHFNRTPHTFLIPQGQRNLRPPEKIYSTQTHGLVLQLFKTYFFLRLQYKERFLFKLQEVYHYKIVLCDSRIISISHKEERQTKPRTKNIASLILRKKKSNIFYNSMMGGTKHALVADLKRRNIVQIPEENELHSPSLSLLSLRLCFLFANPKGVSGIEM